MTTVLFVLFILFAAGKALSLLDGQHASTAEVSNYLHYEYNMAKDNRPSLSLLRHI